jgi:hypothetical protein
LLNPREASLQHDPRSPGVGEKRLDVDQALIVGHRVGRNILGRRQSSDSSTLATELIPNPDGADEYGRRRDDRTHDVEPGFSGVGTEAAHGQNQRSDGAREDRNVPAHPHPQRA